MLALARQVLRWQAATSGAFALGVMGVEPGVGTSTVAWNLATMLGSLDQGDILLVEADFGRPDVSQRIVPHGDATGLSDVLAGLASPLECIHATAVDSLSILAAGTATAAPDQLPLEHLLKLNHELATAFRLAVYDLPAMTRATAATLACQMDGAIIVVEAAHQAHAQRMAALRRRIADGNVHILGLVVNKA